MKTIGTLLLIMATVASLSAQIQKGTVLLGGIFGFKKAGCQFLFPGKGRYSIGEVVIQ